MVKFIFMSITVSLIIISCSTEETPLSVNNREQDNTVITQDSTKKGTDSTSSILTDSPKDSSGTEITDSTEVDTTDSTVKDSSSTIDKDSIEMIDTTTVPDIMDTSIVGEPQLTDMKMYIFGHSLLKHVMNIVEVPGDETSVPHWQHFLAREAGYEYAVSGQYGFLTNHDDLPPRSQWHFDSVPSNWEDWKEDFGDVDFNTVIITEGNFMQWQPAVVDYYHEPSTSPVKSTLQIIDWLEEQEPGMTIYIYENWPDMSQYMVEFPPTPDEFSDYNKYVLGDFHDWWVDYVNELKKERPNVNIQMMSVGPIIAKSLTETSLKSIPILELYEDDAPHGRATLYFIASLITYMETYGVKAPTTYDIPEIIHEDVKNNFQETVDFIWEEMKNYEY